MNRKEVLKEVTKLTETHCRQCEMPKHINDYKTSQKHCLKVCEVGKQFQELGKLLAIKKKQKIKIEKEPETRGRKNKFYNITKEMFLAELESDKNYREIEQSLGIGKKSIRYLFSLYGLEGRRGSNYKSIKSIGVPQTRDSQSH